VCNPHAGLPITDSDEQIAEALSDVSIPTLTMSLVHMSSDESLIRVALRPAGLFRNEVQGYLSEEHKAAVRALALPIIAVYRDRGCPGQHRLEVDVDHLHGRSVRHVLEPA
jgi:4-hydroxyacetophenone monooxygenase